MDDNCGVLMAILLSRGAMRVSNSEGGAYRIDFNDGTSRMATDDEIAAAQLGAARASMECTPFQFRAALHGAGLLATVEQIMADPVTDAIARLAWQHALTFKRTSPTIAAFVPLLAGVLSMDSEQAEATLDGVFRAAMGIDA